MDIIVEDLYLKQMTNVLKTISGEKCLVGRGGDEFIAFFIIMIQWKN